MNDHDLDTLFAQARTLTPADDEAAERFLSSWPQRRSRQRNLRAGWLGALLASAAAVAGLAVLRPAPDLPASAAYGVYQSAWGDGW